MWNSKQVMRHPNQIRAYRLERGWTQKDLAQRVGVSHATISSWEMGYVLARLPRIFRLAVALDTLVEALYWPLYRPTSPVTPAIVRATNPPPRGQTRISATRPFPQEPSAH